MKIMLDEGAIMPTRAHENDAGLAFFGKVKQVAHTRCAHADV